MKKWAYYNELDRFAAAWLRELIKAGLIADGEVDERDIRDAREWVARLCSDVGALGYGVGAAVLPAVGVGLDHARPRVYFVGHANRDSQSGLSVDAEVGWMPRYRSDTGGVVSADGVSRDMVALSGFGNAIVPQVAQAFIEAYMTVVGSHGNHSVSGTRIGN